MRGLNNHAIEVWMHLVEVREAELPGADKDENQNVGAHHLTFWKKAVEQAKGRTNFESATNAGQSVEALSRALDGIAYGFITYGDIQLYSLSSRLLGEEQLLLIKEVVPLIQTGIQTIVDTALNELGEGDARTLSILRDVVKKGQFRQAFDRIVRNPVLASLELETSKSTFKATGGTHHNYFATGKEKKASDLNINYYDNDQEMAELTEIQSTMRNIYVARERQVDLLDEIYGGLDNSGIDKKNLTDPQKAYADVIEQLEGFNLHSDDDWRQFLLLMLEQQGDKPNIRELVYLIETYLQVFTEHTPYNIYDQDVDYLGRPFPRTMTGKLIHDCGVYALRIAYMLSLVKDKLGLKFHAVRLPNHVGLIITGDNQPPIIAHNDRLTPLEQDDLDKNWANWNQSVRQKKFEDATNTEFYEDHVSRIKSIMDVALPRRV